MAFFQLISILTVAVLTAASSTKRVACPDGKNTATNAACCAFFTLAEDLQANLFDNTCGATAQAALHLSFNDAIGISASGGPSKGNGADGSIITFSTIELEDPANSGLAGIIDSLKPFLQQFDISAGDLVQFAGAVGLSNCPGAPSLQFLAGRPNATVPAASGLIPVSSDSATALFARFADAGFSTSELVSLLAAHSTALLTGLSASTLSLDSTPAKFDTQFFLEVLLAGNATVPGVSGISQVPEPSVLVQEGVVRLQSDFAVSRDAETACVWQNMINNQQLMMSDFKSAQAKLSATGQSVGGLIDCSEALPTPLPLSRKSATFPPGTSVSDVQQVCSSPFPSVGSA